MRTLRRFGFEPEKKKDLRLIAVNHDEDAIRTHELNHPWAEHYHDDIEALDPREILQGCELLMLVGSPPCTHFANARGGKPRDDQQRATPRYLLDWIRVGNPLVGLFENVPEFEGWGPLTSDGKIIKERKGEHFLEFVEDIKDLGYDVAWNKFNAADYGSAQSRKRLFIQIRRDDEAITWPVPTHGRQPGTSVRKWRGAIEILDLTQPTTSIFTRAKPLSEKTRARIARGIRSRGIFWELLAQAVEAEPRSPASGPVPLARMMAETPIDQWPKSMHMRFVLGQHAGAILRDADEPLNSICAGGAERFVEAGFTFSTDRPQNNRSLVKDASEPIPTVTAHQDRIAYGEVAFHLPVDGPGGNGTNNPPRSLDLPLSSIRASRGGGHIVETPFLVPQHGERPGQLPRYHDCADPFPTLPCNAQPDLVVMQLIDTYNGNNKQARDVDEVLPAITTVDRHALTQVVARRGWLADVCTRMLIIKELARGQSFADEYQWYGKPRSIRKQIGNAVDVNQAEALTYALLNPILGSN